ncbi:glycosyltransferase 87 family protein [Nocardia sp. BMG51109]|uniref:glycosyltransferase 87 family protein n=1 Tax=Nocardia sp. BMG51109 TaxID=1056816 RepID=UPI0007C4B4EC|nr:glycosyltransferase 87 family protein [Nocardia sp. BMG51109]
MRALSGLWVVWVVTRALIVVFTGVTALPHSIWDASAADLTLYREWAEMIVRHGIFPLHDERWQYPPGAAALFVVPWLLGGGHGYSWLFFGLVGVADAGVLWMLIRAARRDGRETARTAPWVWVIGVALLGRVCYGRFDLIVAAAAVAALLWATRRPMAAGAAAAAGVLLKLWPLVVLLGLRRRTLWRVSAATAGVAAVAAAGLTAWGPGLWSFLRFQSERGLQIESPAATPLLIARLLNGGWSIAHRYGAEELIGPGVPAVSRACVAAVAVGGVVLLAAWWRKQPPATDLVLAAALLALVTSRVLSPQYVVWAVGVAAVCTLDARTTQRPVVWLILATALLSQVEFPFVYDRVATGSWPGVVVLALRNGLLVCAVVLSVVRLWRSPPPCRRQDSQRRSLAGEEPVGAAALAGPDRIRLDR